MTYVTNMTYITNMNLNDSCVGFKNTHLRRF